MMHLILILFTFCSLPDIRYSFFDTDLKNENNRKTILIYPFKNTGTSKFSFYSEGITESVISDLSMIKGVAVISQEDRKKAIKELAYRQTMGLDDSDISKIANLTGADYFLSGSYSVEGDMIRIIGRLVQTSSGIILKSIKIDGLTKNIFKLQDNLALDLINSTAKLNADEINLFKNKPEYSGTAYEYFSKGLEKEDSSPLEALDLYKKSLNIEGNYLHALLRAGAVSLTLDQISESTIYFNKAKSLREKMGLNSNPDYINYTQIGNIYFNKGNYDRALENFNIDKNLKEKNGMMNSLDYANTLSNIAIVLYSKGEYDKSIDYFNKSQSIREDLGKRSTNSYAMTLNNLGNVYKSAGKQNKALEYYNNAQILREKLGFQNTSGYATTLGNMGIIYNSKGEQQKALDYYNNAQILREKLGLQNTSGYATTLGNIANLFSSKKNYEKALEFYTKSQLIRDGLKQQNSSGYASTLNNIGSVYSSKGEYLKAKDIYTKAQSIRDKLGLQNTADYAITLYNLGNVFENLGQSEKAKELYLNSKLIRDRIGILESEKNSIDKIE